MALEEVKCDCCGEVLMRDDWDGQYYQEDKYGLWNKITPYIDEDDYFVCTEQCYLDDKDFQAGRLEYLRREYQCQLVDIRYQEWKDGER